MSLGARLLGIKFDISYAMWLEQLNTCIQLAELDVNGVKVILTGGQAPRGLTVKSQRPCMVFSPFHYVIEKNPVRLMSAAWCRDATNPIYQVKSTNYLEAIIARRQALEAGVDDALFFNTAHEVTETAVANFFMVKQDHVFTPALSCGVLAGVMRNRVLHLCKAHRIPCSELAIKREMIASAETIFITNALQGIRLVSACDDWYATKELPIISRLQALIDNDAVLI